MSVPPNEPSEFRGSLLQELQALEEDLQWTEKAHFAHAEALSRANLWLGLTATISAGIAAAAVVAEAAPVVAGLMALVAAVTSGLVTFLKPTEAEKRHLDAGRQLGALRVRTRQAIHIDMPHSSEPASLRRLVSTITDEKAAIDQGAPGTSGRAFRRARVKIEAGHFEHTTEAHRDAGPA